MKKLDFMFLFQNIPSLGLVLFKKQEFKSAKAFLKLSCLARKLI